MIHTVTVKLDLPVKIRDEIIPKLTVDCVPVSLPEISKSFIDGQSLKSYLSIISAGMLIQSVVD